MKEKVELDIKFLEKIADYYEFPLTAFFAPVKFFEGKRKQSIRQKIKKFKEQLDNLVKDFLEKI